MPRAPVSRPDTFATGRPERPDPCADPPTVAIRPTRVMPAVPVDDPGHDLDAATVPELRPVTSHASTDGGVRPAAVVFVVALLNQLAPLTVVLTVGSGPGTLFLAAWQVTVVADLAAMVTVWRPGRVRLRRLLMTVGPVLLLVAVLVNRLPVSPPAADVVWVLVLGAVLRLVAVPGLPPGRGGTVLPPGRGGTARLHVGAAVVTLLAVGGTAAVVSVTLAPTASDLASPATMRAVLLPVAAAFVLVQVACAAATLATRRAGAAP